MPTRRTVLRTIGASALSMTVLGTAGATEHSIEIVERINLPDTGFLSLGSSESEDQFLTNTGEDWYYIGTDGAIKDSGTFSASVFGRTWGVAEGPDYAAWGDEGTLQVNRANEDVQGYTLPDLIQSAEYAEEVDQLWVGGDNGKVWRLDENFDIQSTIDVAGPAYGVAHDGTNLWVAADSIVKIDPSSGEPLETFDFPTRIADLTWMNDSLWAVGTEDNDQILELSIQGNETPDASFTYTPTEPAVGTDVEFTSTSTDSDGSIDSREWAFGDGTTGTGASVTHTFEAAQSYTVELTVTDDDGATARSEQTVTVQPAQDTSGVQLAVEDAAVSTDGTATVDVVVEGVSNGIGAFDLDIGVADGSVATIDSATIPVDVGGFSTSAVNPEGTGAELEAIGVETVDSGSIAVASLTLTGLASGETELTLSVESIGDADNETYTVTETTNGTLSVEEEPSPVSGFDSRPTDPDGDGQYEDINGDGEFDIVDVSAFFENVEDQSIQSHTSAYDFNSDGSVDIVDVSDLFSQV